MTPERLVGRLVVAVGALLLLTFPVINDDAYYQNMIILSLVFAVGASGLNIITGFAGYVSLGQGAFLGLGGYTVGVLATRFDGVSPWVWVPVAGVVAAVVSLVLGLVALRSRGPSFVIITVAFLFLVQVIAVNWVSLTGGTSGLTLPLPSWDRDIINWPFYYVLVAILAVQLVLTWWIRRTKLGMGLIAIREDETKAATIGINLPVEKIIGFVASSVFVGMAGAVYGYYLTFIDPRGMFSILLSVQLVLSLLVGGRGTLWGPVLGAFLIEPLNEVANNNFGGGNTRLFLFGGLLVLVVIWVPKGILPALEALLRRRRTAGKAGLTGARIGESGRLPGWVGPSGAAGDGRSASASGSVGDSGPALASGSAGGGGSASPGGLVGEGGPALASGGSAVAGGLASDGRLAGGGGSAAAGGLAGDGGSAVAGRVADGGGSTGTRGVAGGGVSALRERVAEPDRPLLEVSGLAKRFGGIRAVVGCSFAVPEGSMTGLIGPNGSGKTTVFNLIDNTIAPDAGKIVFAGRRIERLPSWGRAHLGIGRTFQITRLFGEMTVLENVVAVQRSFSWAGLTRVAVSGREARAAEELLDFVGMRTFRDQPAHALSYGQQKLVELAQVLMLDPKLILLDEPAGGINPVLVERMAEMLRELNAHGTTLLIVEHNMPFVLGLCDPVHVLARGTTMSSGTPAEIQTDPAVIEAYLGTDFPTDFQPEEAT